MKEKIHCRFSVLNSGADFTIKQKKRFKKALLIMRYIAIMLFVFSIHVSASSLAQNVSIKKQDISLKEAFRQIRLQTGYYFIYNNNEVKDAKLVSLAVSNVPVETALDALLKGMSLTYSIDDKIIAIKPLKTTPVVTRASVADRIIKGKVTDEEDGMPVVGATIRINNIQVASVTDEQGAFSITVKQTDKVLLFSSIGYVNKEINLTEATNYNIVLVRSNKQLDEVVIAFGTSNKKELSNSVTKISAKDIEQRPISNLTSAIVGSSPGVMTTAGSGQPGIGPDIRIRGFGSVTGNNSPLYVLDGAPYEGIISNINPEDIDNISILKDASATALYGSRAANGVVLITTKKGTPNRNNISVKLTQAFSERGLPNYDVLDAYSYFPVVWETLKNGTSGNAAAATKDLKEYVGWNPFNVADDEIVLESGLLNPNAKLLYPDDVSFRDELQRVGMRTDLSLALSGGGTKSDHYISLNYLDEKGYVIGSDFQRFSARLRVNAQPREWLKAGLNIFGTYTKSDQANESSGINENPFYIDLILAPIFPVYRHDPITGAYLLDANGNKLYDTGDYRPLFTGRNVVFETLNNINQVRRNSLNSVGNVEAKFLKDFKFSSSLSITLGNFRSNIYDNSVMGDAVGIGKTERNNSLTTFFNFNQLLTWSKNINKHKVTALLGHENYLSYFDFLGGSKRSEGIAGLPVLDNMTTTTNFGSYDWEYKTEGYFSRFDYSYDATYILSGSYRRDGSSRFSKNSRWGDFWSLSAAYNIDRAKFFKVKWINDLKLRASVGAVGNDKTGSNFTYQDLFTLGYNNGTEGGALYMQKGNDQLQWESNLNADIALEFSMFKNRFGGTFEVFRRQSSNLLFDVTIPLTSGLLTRDVNFGSMRNEGIELQLNGTIIQQKRFKWNIDLNATTFRNKILSLPSSYEGRISGTKKYATGKSRYEFWLRDWVAVDPATGANLFRPIDPLLNPVTYNGETLTSNGANAEYHYSGSAIADVMGSINNTFNYKNFSLQMMFIYQVGGYSFDRDYQSLMFRGSAGRTMHVDQLKRWQNPGDISNVPKLSTGTVMYDSDQWLTKSDYLNLRTIALTYILPKKFLARTKLTNAKVYVNGENLFITSARKGMDPTQTFTGDPTYTYAPSRIVSFGLNLTL